MYYASVGVLALIMHFIINLDYLKWFSKAELSHMRLSTKRYRIFLYCVALYYLTDIMWGAFYAQGLTAVTYIDTILYFLSMVTTVLLWTRTMVVYLGRRGALTTAFITAGWMIFVFEAVSLLINCFIPIVFDFDEQGVYHTYSGRVITLVLQLVLYLLTGVYAFVVAYKSDGIVRRHHRTIALSSTVMSAFIALQCIFPLMPFYTVGCLIATTIVHTYVSYDDKEEQRRQIGETRLIAYRDALTGSRSVHAYVETRAKTDELISAGTVKEFGIAVFDLNGLKHVNDTQGHEAGDKYIISGCKLIREYFPNCSVYRIGGDEFVIILEGEAYHRRDEMLAEFNDRMDSNCAQGLVTISAGLDIFRPGEDNDMNTVFVRADSKMYERKKEMKAAA